MSAALEDLIRAAQQEQANRAVHPQRILAGLPRRQAQLARRRRLVVVVAAAAVAAVLAVPALALTSRGAGPAPFPAVSPTVSASPSTPPISLRYRPTWLPEGYAEYRRNAIEGGTSRLWSPAAPESAELRDSPILFLSVSPGAAAAGDGEPVDINGAAGVYRPAERLVTWRAGGAVLTVGTIELNLPKGTMLRVARSVRPDTGTLDLPFRLAAAPAGLREYARGVTGSAADDWLAEIRLTSGTDSGGSATVSLGTTTEAPQGGTSLTVSGRPARYVKSPRMGYYLVVDLGAGRVLTVLAIGRDRAATIAVAEQVRLVSAPDLSWLGR